MATPIRSSRADRARQALLALKAITGGTLSLIALFGLTSGAVAPDLGSAELFAAAQQRASLSLSGTDIIITGSLDHMFRGGSFAGPNRAEKQDRALPLDDVLAVSRDFDGIRARLAALRNPGQPVLVEADAAPEKIDMASIDPALNSSALDAISAVAAPGADVPTPRTMSTRLAYARADLPATVFDGTIMDKKGKKVSEKELWCMATAIYFESRGESYRGQVAVGQVVMNRVAHKLYPDTICGVVYQNQSRRNSCQFSFACDGIPERVSDQKSWKQAQEIARGIVSGSLYLDEVGYATHYHATYVYPHWAPRMTKVTKVGTHVFYHFKRGWKFG